MSLNMFLHIAAVGEEFVAHLTHELRVRYLKRRKQHRMSVALFLVSFYTRKHSLRNEKQGNIAKIRLKRHYSAGGEEVM
jgi:hypothetical protein